MFKDRRHAAQELAKHLTGYSGADTLVLGIPRGGVEIAYYIAISLNADFSLVIARKLGYPEHPEAAFGAIAEDGSTYLSSSARSFVSENEIKEVKKREKKELERRIQVLRKGKPLPSLEGRVIILADDGIATGATLFATIMLCKKQKPAKIIVAAPISSRRMESDLRDLVDDVIILEKPRDFYAVSQGYRHFDNLTDEETISFVNSWEKEHQETDN